MVKGISLEDSVIKTFQFANRLGCIPVISTVVGVVRIIFSLLAMLFRTFQWVFTGKEEIATDRLPILGMHCLVGLAELIPGLNIYIHIQMHMENRGRENYKTLAFS